MITLTKSGNAIVFEFDDNSHYLNDGTIEVPVNSLTLVTDDSQMATFRKAASNDIFISATYDELGMSKADLETFYKENMVGSTGGGSGSGITSGEVQTMIDESISGKADTSDVQEIASDVSTVSGDVSTLSGSVDSNHNAITALNGDVQTLSGQVETDEKVTANALVDLDNRKLDASAYTPTDLSNYYTKSQTNTQINNATDSLLDAGEFYEYTDSNDERVGDIEDRLSEDEEVTSAALNELNEALSGKQDTLIAGTNITISGNVISAEGGGGGGLPESAFTAYTASTDARLAEDEEVTAAGLNALNDALSGKQDTLSAGTNITISGNVISAEGGGKAIEAGRGISVTTGATADTVSFNLPISAATGEGSLSVGGNSIAAKNSYSIGSGNTHNATNTNYTDCFSFGKNNSSDGNGNYFIGDGNSTNVGSSLNLLIGRNNHIYIQSKNNAFIGDGISATNTQTNYSYAFGDNLTITKQYETALGIRNKSERVSNNYVGDSGNTLFSVGNGHPSNNYKHNALEIRQNGDFYIVNTDDTTYSNYYEKPMYRLQDLIVALGGLKLVSLTQAQYDALATKDASTLYIITNNS